MKYKNFVFDLYGTLADVYTDDDAVRTDEKMAEFFSSHGAKYTAEEYRTCMHDFRAIQEKKREGSVYKPTGEVIRYPETDVLLVYEELFAAKGVAATRADVLRAARYYRGISTVTLRRYPGVTELFGQLRAAGRSIYLLSNAQREYTVYDLEKLGLYSCFDGILLSSDYGCRKPDPIFFGELTRQFGVLPEESLMIGNDRRSDIYGANLFGMDSVLLVTGEELAAPIEGVFATYTVAGGTYRELAELLPELLA